MNKLNDLIEDFTLLEVCDSAADNPTAFQIAQDLIEDLSLSCEVGQIDAVYLEPMEVAGLNAECRELLKDYRAKAAAAVEALERLAAAAADPKA